MRRGDGMRALKDRRKTGFDSIKPIRNAGVHLLWGANGANVGWLVTDA